MIQSSCGWLTFSPALSSFLCFSWSSLLRLLSPKRYYYNYNTANLFEFDFLSIRYVLLKSSKNFLGINPIFFFDIFLFLRWLRYCTKMLMHFVCVTGAAILKFFFDVGVLMSIFHFIIRSTTTRRLSPTTTKLELVDLQQVFVIVLMGQHHCRCKLWLHFKILCVSWERHNNN